MENIKRRFAPGTTLNKRVNGRCENGTDYEGNY